MYPGMAAYATAMGYSKPGVKWIIRFDSVREVFETWDSARDFLLKELQSLALDFDCEYTWKGWDEVRAWRNSSDTYVYAVSAGDPPGKYWMVRNGFEDMVTG